MKSNQIIAHRGAWKDFGLPQNSLAAFLKAQELPVAGIELDLQLTADRQVIVFHDDHINELAVNRINYSELGEYLLSNGEKIPVLPEVLKCWNRKHTLWLELKPSDLTLQQKKIFVDEVLKLLGDETENVFFISFDLVLLKMIKLQSPVPCLYLGDEFSVEFLKSEGIDGLDFQCDTYSDDLIGKLKRNNMLSNTWTVNSKELGKVLIEAGIDFITTDEVLLFV